MSHSPLKVIAKEKGLIFLFNESLKIYVYIKHA